MSGDLFYKAHWKYIEKDRMDGYLKTFQWSPDSLPYYEPAEIRSGHRVADFGCGPGYTAVEIANWVGAEGHVYAFDINSSFVALTRKNAQAAGLGDRVTAQECDGTFLPLEDASLDRVSACNVIMYVDDAFTTLKEFHRVLRPGGKMHAIDSDWHMMVVEPVPRALWSEFVEAAGHACRTVDMGRKLYGFAGQAGFADREVQVIPFTDSEGSLLPMVENMAKYARLSERMGEARIDEVVQIAYQAISDRNYLAISPEFVVTATR